ncbi:MAG TPA: adenosylcobinamide-GDP ribazoletransferase [Bryobacteraceae bacterium]|nr:adenosylcobinamide-GDP ribazoletransferase [Bryobacteraceae bacterium]
MKSLLAAVAFLTRIPVGRITTFDAMDVARSSGWFPLVGALLGALQGFAATLLRNRLPLGVVAVLLIILDALATGALHFDGLADAADGFGGGKNREDVLRIMRDHAIGSYGGVALAACVGLKVTAYAALLAQADWLAALILIPVLGRWSILLLTAALPYARPSASPVAGMGKWQLVWGTTIIALSVVCAMSARAGIAAAMVVVVTACFGMYCNRRIGGITGDTLGANVQLCESAALLTFLWSGSAR